MNASLEGRYVSFTEGEPGWSLFCGQQDRCYHGSGATVWINQHGEEEGPWVIELFVDDFGEDELWYGVTIGGTRLSESLARIIDGETRGGPSTLHKHQAELEKAGGDTATLESLKDILTKALDYVNAVQAHNAEVVASL